MEWIYLSPHLDDAVYSCGGLIWEQVQAGDRVSIWTICAGDPPPGALSTFAQTLHNRWGLSLDIVGTRRMEDSLACKIVGASYHHRSYLDCIYRISPKDGRYLYASEDAIQGDLHPEEDGLIKTLSQELNKLLIVGAHLVCPTGIGKHVDHQLTRAAAEVLSVPLWYYADLPYVLLESECNPVELGKEHVFPVSDKGLNIWQAGAAAYASQISSFWQDADAMCQAIASYCHESGGVRLWRGEGIAG